MAYFKGSIKVDEKTVDSKGKEKTKEVTEHYVFKADTYTEAEVILNKKLEEEKRKFRIKKIAEVTFSDILVDPNPDLKFWFKCKVVFEMENDKGKIKKVNNFVLANADDAKQAYVAVNEFFTYMLAPYSIPNVDVTNVTDYIE